MELLKDKAYRMVKDDCHRFLENRDNECIMSKCHCIDMPVIGVTNTDWHGEFRIVNEHFFSTEISDEACIVNLRLAIWQDGQLNDSLLVIDGTVVCKKYKDNDIEYKAIHISYNDGHTPMVSNTSYSDEIYKKVSDYIFDVVIEYDFLNNLLSYDPKRYEEFFGQKTHFISADQWFWHMCTCSLISEDAEKMDIFRQADMEKRIKNHDYVIKRQLRVKLKENEIRWIEMKVVLITDKTNTIIKNIIVLIKDINDRKNSELEIIERARVDELSKVWNRYYTELLINQELGKRVREENMLFMIIDIDHFKNVNDTYGHITGDLVIQMFAEKITSSISERDIFGRIGGDEFVVLLKSCNDKQKTIEKMQDIQNAIRFAYEEDDKMLEIHGSVGAVFVDSEYATFHELYSAADKNLYKAKEEGRDRYILS